MTGRHSNNYIGILVHFLHFLSISHQVVKLYYTNGFYKESLLYAEKIIAFDTSIYKFDNTEILRYIQNCKFAIDAIQNPVDFNPKNLGLNINSDYEEYLPAISVDGNTLVYSRRYIRNNIFQEDF